MPNVIGLSDFLWDKLRQIAQSVDGSPWLVGGDFNTILHPHEREGSDSDKGAEMCEFAKVIADCVLFYAGCVGSPFTWEMQGLKERLDRILFSKHWPFIFPITFNDPLTSY